MTLLPGFDWTVPGQDSGAFVTAPCRLVLHTTEGASAAGAIAAFRSTGSWPHFTVDPVAKVRYQHIPLDLGARALVNAPGGVETNREDAIQIEIIGFAAKAADWSDDALQWLATEVLAPILAATGITTTHPVFVGADRSPASVKAAQRMTYAAWDAFNGICGHQHVPENDHWDPGAFPIDRCLAFLPGHTTTPTSGAPMVILLSDKRTVVALPNGDLLHVNPGYKQAGMAILDLTADTAASAALLKDAKILVLG